ncbi:MAG: DEAD/DEAH box helicase [Endomicrobium sp.]|nr:DEAD/DEAH box helicase [Endomicrobium sp.]
MKLRYSALFHYFFCIADFMEREIPKRAGFRWDTKQKQWVTTNVESAMKLLEYADPMTKEILQKKKEELSATVEASKKAMANINLLRPQGLEYLPFQKAGIEFCMNRRNVLLADEMGLGKTIQAIGVINNVETVKRVIVITTASTKLNWLAELQKWLTKPLHCAIVDTSAQLDLSNQDVIIVAYSRIVGLLEALKEAEFDLCIVDEVHYTKSSKAQRSKAVKAVCKKAIRNIHMTGTPICNRPAELFPIIERLGFDMNWIEYIRKYCGAYRNTMGFWDTSGAKNLDELQTKLRGTIMIRRMKSDVLKELPSKIRQAVVLEADTKELRDALKEEKQYANVAEQYIDKVKDLQSQDASFFEMTIARKNTAIAKVPAVIKFVEDLLKNTDKVVLFAHHKDVITPIMQNFGAVAVKISGDDKVEDRQESIKQFQNNPKIKIFVGSILAAGAGITLTAASTVVFAELDWTPGNMQQAEDRCHRIGQKDTVMVYHLIVDGSMDVKISKMLIDKQSNIDKALNAAELKKGA